MYVTNKHETPATFWCLGRKQFCHLVCPVCLTEQTCFQFKTTVVGYWPLSKAKTWLTLQSVLYFHASGAEKGLLLLRQCEDTTDDQVYDYIYISWCVPHCTLLYKTLKVLSA